MTFAKISPATLTLTCIAPRLCAVPCHNVSHQQCVAENWDGHILRGAFHWGWVPQGGGGHKGVEIYWGSIQDVVHGDIVLGNARDSASIRNGCVVTSDSAMAAPIPCCDVPDDHVAPASDNGKAYLKRAVEAST